MKTHSVYVLAIVVLIVVGFGLSAPAVQPPTPHTPQKWEHLAMTHQAATIDQTPELSAKIVQLGDEGWELVTVSGVIRQGETTQTIFFFKRPK